MRRRHITQAVLGLAGVALVAVFAEGWVLPTGAAVLAAASAGNAWARPLWRRFEVLRTARRPHAAAAMKAAEARDPSLDLADIVLHTSEYTGVDYRVAPVPAYSDYLSVVLTLVSTAERAGLMQFFLQDEVGEIYDTREQFVRLAWGKNTVTLQLPFHFERVSPDGVWTLHVAFDGAPLASHHFLWRTLERDALLDDDLLAAEHADGDGELDLLAPPEQDDALSLDDLLTGYDANRLQYSGTSSPGSTSNGDMRSG